MIVILTAKDSGVKFVILLEDIKMLSNERKIVNGFYLYKFIGIEKIHCKFCNNKIKNGEFCLSFLKDHYCETCCNDKKNQYRFQEEFDIGLRF